MSVYYFIISLTLCDIIMYIMVYYIMVSVLQIYTKYM